jgi:hypothetical protein
VGHIVEERVSVTDCALPLLMPVLVLSVQPEPRAGGDRVVTRAALAAQIERWLAAARAAGAAVPAVALRALGAYSRDAFARDFSGTNPPYLDPAAAELLARHFAHLLVDLPSIDREQSGKGAPACHAIFFGVDREPERATLRNADPQRAGATITELVNLHSGIADGFHLLSLQVAPIVSDAAPSRPLLFPCELRTAPGNSRRALVLLAAASAAALVLAARWLLQDDVMVD